MKPLRCCLIWIIVIGILASIYPLLYRPLQAYWYQRKGLCLSLVGFISTVYSKTEAKAAIPILQKSLEYNFHRWEPHFLLGTAYSQLKRFDDARKEYELCLRFNPGHSRSYYNLGNAYYHLGDYDEAIKQYVKCLRIEPTFEQAINNIKVMRMLKKRKEH